MPGINHRSMRNSLAWLAAALLIANTLTWAAESRFKLTAFGNFTRMRHTGDTSGQVKLADLPQTPGNWGMGALAGQMGELVLHDGHLLVSRGDDAQGRVGNPQVGDEAALFVVAQVQQWVDVTVSSDMNQAQFEAFIIEQAKMRGLGNGTPFPFLVQGRYTHLVWHVVTGTLRAKSADDGRHAGHANKGAEMRMFEQPGAAGRLVGVYSGAELEGVVSHPGTRFHIHYADEALSISGHVDAYGVARGAVLKLPVS